MQPAEVEQAWYSFQRQIQSFDRLYLVMCVITILLVTILILLLKDREYIRYQKKKNSYCEENQIMAFENIPIQTSHSITITILFSIVTFIAVGTAVVLGVNYNGDSYSIGIVVFIAVITLTCAIIVHTTQYSSKPDFSRIIEKMVKMLENTSFTDNESTMYTVFTSTLEKLKDSILDKYTAYKEEQNPGSYYVRSDIETEFKNLFVNKTTPIAFATELVKYMNFPYDAILFNSIYSAWRSNHALCTTAIETMNNRDATAENRRGVLADYTKCMLTIPTQVTYKNTQKQAPLYLTWLLLIVMIYYFIHPLYPDYKFYIVMIAIVTILVIMLYYIMGVRNNL